MLRRFALLGCVALAGLLAACTITIGPADPDTPRPGGTVQTTLDRARADIVIAEIVGAAAANVSATLVDASGRTLQLRSNQVVEINALELVGPNSARLFTTTVPVAAAYTVTVREPTRGVEQTTVAGPDTFEITAPGPGGPASLSGFTVTWTGADPGQQVELRLSQTVFGVPVSRAFGPFEDGGSVTFSAADLAVFAQGADLFIEVTKLVQADGLRGFSSGKITIGRTATRIANPQP